MRARSSLDFPLAVGPFLVSEPIAAGGMATIHLAATSGPDPRLLALKRLHAALEGEESYRNMLLDEGAINGRVRHPNVVLTHGVASLHERLFLVMDYVEGVSFQKLIGERTPGALPPRVVSAIVASALRGLHAAHEAVDEAGRPLGVVHRDVSPQNILVGTDGVARIVDFGIAKAKGRLQVTRRGEVKGKLSYMAPEQLSGGPIDRRADVYAAGIVLWEALTGYPLFDAENEVETLAQLLEGCKSPPSDYACDIPPELDEVVARALFVTPEGRFATALEMAEALEIASPPADADEVGCWVRALGAPSIRAQARVRHDLERRVVPPAPAETTLVSQRPGPSAPAPRPLSAASSPSFAQMIALGAFCFLMAMTAAVGACRSVRSAAARPADTTITAR